MTIETLGKKLDDSVTERDAIHVAILPVEAMEKLHAGQAVSADGKAGGDSIGIVDPFLSAPVFPGERFWLFVTPNTITSLRHDWELPAIDHPVARQPEEVFKGAAEGCGITVESLLEAAHYHCDTGDWRLDNSRNYKRFNDWDAFWEAFKEVTGKHPGEYAYAPFTCSC